MPLKNALVHLIIFLTSFTVVILGCSLNGLSQPLIFQYLQHRQMYKNLHIYTPWKCVWRPHSPLEPTGETHTSWAGTQLSGDKTCVQGSCFQHPVHRPAGCCAATAPEKASLQPSSNNTTQQHYVKLCYSFMTSTLHLLKPIMGILIEKNWSLISTPNIMTLTLKSRITPLLLLL